METFTKQGIWKYGDITYEIIGYNEKTRKVIIEKSNRFGIYYTDIRVTQITRKLTKDGFINLERISHSLRHIIGFKDQ